MTAENRGEYAILYMKYKLQTSIQKQWDSFRSGFNYVCEGEIFDMFSWQELKCLVCGNESIDFNALETACQYEDPYSESTPVVGHLWELLHKLDEKNKRLFLCFCTGSDRIPIRGLGDLRLTISRADKGHSQEINDLSLPTAHTCFNHLFLPPYSTKEILQERLLLAIQNSKGFGMQ